MLNSIQFSMEETVTVFLYFSMMSEKVSLMVKIKKTAQLSIIETVNINQEGGFK